jgi:hypothetical protein
VSGWGRYAIAALVIVAAGVVLALLPSSKHKALSQSELRRFGPVCASSGHLVSVARVGGHGRATYRVHCSGGLTTVVTGS